MALPPSLKSIQSFINVSKQFANRDPTVSYYCHLHAIKTGIALAKGDPVAKEAILKLMNEAELFKKQVKDNELIKDEIVAQSYIEDVALKLFNKADTADRAANFDKTMIKMFYVSSQLFTVLEYFGDLNEEVEKKRKYAKWKAVEIDRCLKNGITPTPGPAGGDIEEDDDDPSQYGQPIPPQPSGATPPYPGAQPVFPVAPYPPPNDGTTPPYPPTSSAPYPPPISGTTPPYPPTTSSTPPYPPTSSAMPPTVGTTPTPLPRSNPPQLPVAAPRTTPTATPTISGKVDISGVQKETVQKYCKYAISSLDFSDTEGAIGFLEKSLKILRTGKE